MRVAVVINNWGLASEVWAERMLHHLGDDLKLIISDSPPSLWNSKVPGYALQPKTRPEKWFRRIPKRIIRSIIPPLSLGSTLKNKDIDTLLINFAHIAWRLRKSWMNREINVFIHCHGFDVHLSGRSERWPHLLNQVDFSEKELQDLANHATFIANSEFTKKSLLEYGVPEDKIRLKYFGVPLPEQPKPINSSTSLRWLYLGRFIDSKGPDLVIESFLRAKSMGLSGRLVLAGDGVLLESCEIMARRSAFSDQIEFRGAITSSEAQKLLSQSDVFLCHNQTGLLTNRAEAFGVAVVEAMAHGLPVLTGKSGGVVESIVDGETGFLVQPQDVDSYVERMLAIDSDRELLASLSRNARQRVVDRFQISHEKSRLFDILDPDCLSVNQAMQ